MHAFLAHLGQTLALPALLLAGNVMAAEIWYLVNPTPAAARCRGRGGRSRARALEALLAAAPTNGSNGLA